MNEFTRKAEVKNVDRRSRPQGKPWVLSLTFKCALMLAMIFGAFALRVSLNDRTEALTRNAESIRRQTRETEIQIRNLVARREKLYSMKYIQSKIRQYHLALRPTSHSQIRYLKRFDTSMRGDSVRYASAGVDSSSDTRGYTAFMDR